MAKGAKQRAEPMYDAQRRENALKHIVRVWSLFWEPLKPTIYFVKIYLNMLLNILIFLIQWHDGKKKTEQVSSFVMLHANLNQVLFFSIAF